MSDAPKILIFDIEKMYAKAAIWQTGKQYVGHHQLLDNSRIICICYKWLGEKTVHSLTWNKNRCDKTMLRKFNKIAGEADFLVAHNGENFDVKELRTAIAIRGLADAWCETPVIDTLKDYRRMFRFDSNRLDTLGQKFAGSGKDKMVFQDWIDVDNGDQAALKKMVKYCKQDVKLLEKVYKRLEKYVVPQGKHLLKPSKLLVKCEECKSNNVIKYGFYTYKDTKLQKYLCKDCFKVNKPVRKVSTRR